MRKILATLALLAGALYTLSAVPAHRGKVLVKQPDGSIIVIQGHGDEWYHYVTDDSGRVVSWNADVPESVRMLVWLTPSEYVQSKPL